MGRREGTLPEAMPPAHRRFIEALREARRDTGQTVDRLSARAGYSRSTIARALAGTSFPSDGLANALILTLARQGLERDSLGTLWQRAKEENTKLTGELSKPEFTKRGASDLSNALNTLYKRAGYPSLRDLQTEGGLSKSTLSRVLQNPASAPAHTVLATADILSKSLPERDRISLMDAVTKSLVHTPRGDTGADIVSANQDGQILLTQVKRSRSPAHHAGFSANEGKVPANLPGIEQENRLFISYAHADNELFDEAVAIFAKDISNFYSAKTGNSLTYFFDRKSIGWGEDWRAEIDHGLDNAMVFMPIITMQYFNRASCRDELNAFKASAERLGVRELILPVVIAGARSITSDHAIPEVRSIEALQYKDLESAFLSGPGTPEWRTALSGLTDDLISIIASAEAEQEARRSSGLPALASEAAAQESGDLLQDMEDLTTLSSRVEEEIEEANEAVVQWVDAIQSDMEEFSSQKTPQQMRTISMRMANNVKLPSIRLRDAGTALAKTTAEADAILRIMVEQLGKAEHPDGREVAQQLTNSMKSESPELQVLISQMSDVLSMLTIFELMSSPLRVSLKPARVGINKLQDAFRVVDSWNAIPDAF